MATDSATALHAACGSPGNTKVVGTLLGARAQCGVRQESGLTPLGGQGNILGDPQGPGLRFQDFRQFSLYVVFGFMICFGVETPQTSQIYWFAFYESRLAVPEIAAMVCESQGLVAVHHRYCQVASPLPMSPGYAAKAGFPEATGKECVAMDILRDMGCQR